MKHCVFCTDEIVGDYFQQVTAWVRNEKRDGVTLRVDVHPPRFACKSCIRRLQHGVSDDQMALL